MRSDHCSFFRSESPEALFRDIGLKYQYMIAVELIVNHKKQWTQSANLPSVTNAPTGSRCRSEVNLIKKARSSLVGLILFSPALIRNRCIPDMNVGSPLLVMCSAAAVALWASSEAEAAVIVSVSMPRIDLTSTQIPIIDVILYITSQVR